MENKFARGPGLFYFWGHGHEFDYNKPYNNLGGIEEFAEFVGNRDDIWYATNIEICDYIAAYKQQIFSMDYSRVYNPICTTLCLQTEKNLFCVKLGEEITYKL